MIKKIFYIFSLLLVLTPFKYAEAGDPVTVITSLSPPYTPFLSEYASTVNNKLQVTLIVNDSRMISHEAKLQMVVEKMGAGIVMRTSDFATTPSLYLTGNITEVLSGGALAEYFEARNNTFSGIEKSRYIQTGRIPDAQYRIGFRVVDARRTDVILSNTAFTTPAWFKLNEPPLLNRPVNNSKERVEDYQTVQFNWVPKHTGFQTNYTFELYTMRIPEMQPEEVIHSLTPDYTEIVNNTNYYLTPSQYPLEPGTRYAWRVKAASAGDELSLFQNQGYSEVYSFVYGSLCPEPENTGAIVMPNNNAEISWEKDPMQHSFEIRFRKAGEHNDEWHTRESMINNYEIRNILEEESQYEYQVKAICGAVESEYTNLQTFFTEASFEDDFQCGNEDDFEITNYQPKLYLYPGDYIYSGKFPVKLTQVSGSHGTFSGQGAMRIPMFRYVQVMVEFSNIKVNEFNQIYEGEIVTIYDYDPDSPFMTTFEEEPELKDEGLIIETDIGDIEVGTIIYVPGVIDDIEIDEDDNIIITDEDGEETIIEPYDGSEDDVIIIEDDDGNQYIIEDGEVTQVSGDDPAPDGPGPVVDDDPKPVEDKPVTQIDEDFLYAISEEEENDKIFDGHTMFYSKSEENINFMLKYYFRQVADYLADTILKLNPNFQLAKIYSGDKSYVITEDGEGGDAEDLDPTIVDASDLSNVKWTFNGNTQSGENFQAPLNNIGNHKLNINALDAFAIEFTFWDKENNFEEIDKLAYLSDYSDDLGELSFDVVISESGILHFRPYSNEDFYKDYGFDDALCHINQQNDDYQIKEIGGIDYYVPWLGVLPNKEVEIKLKYTPPADPKLDSLIILECDKEGLFFNGDNQYKYIIDAMNFIGKDISIKTNRDKDFNVRAYSINTNNQKTLIGKLKVEARDLNTTNKTVRIIRVRRSDEEEYFAFSDAQKENLIQEVNKYYKQAFIEFTHDNSPYTDTLSIDVSSQQIIDDFNEQVHKKMPDVDVNIFYKYLVSRGENKGAAAFTFRKASIHYLNTDKVRIKTAAHELGHNLGLPHPFEWDEFYDILVESFNLFSIKNRTKHQPRSTYNIIDWPIIPDERKYFWWHQINHIKKTE